MALVLRGSYHIYYGPGVVGILVWAALFYWIYLRFRSLILLMVCHAGWDTVGFLSQRWPAVAGGAIAWSRGIWIAAPITWLVERNNPAGIRAAVPTPSRAAAARVAAGPRRRPLLALVGRAALDRPRSGTVTPAPLPRRLTA